MNTPQIPIEEFSDADQVPRDAGAGLPAAVRLQAALLESPTHITVPMWVKLSGISPAAREVADVLIADAMRVASDQQPVLDREFLAWFIGTRRADKGVQPVLDELVAIEFLVVFDGGISAKTGKRLKRRDHRGHQIPDTYACRLNPPPGYRGPNNLAAAYELFRHDRDQAYRKREKTGIKARPSIIRTGYGHVAKPQVKAEPFTKGSAEPFTKGSAEFPQVKAEPFTKGSAEPFTKGSAEFPQVKAEPFTKGSVRFEEIEDLPSGDLSIDSIRLVPGASAAPPGTSEDNVVVSEVAKLVRRLPWLEWAQRTGRRVSQHSQGPSEQQLAEVHAAILAAGAEYGVTLEQASAIACRAMAEAKLNPVVYLVAAFTPPKLLVHLARLTVAPLSDDPLPLPEALPKGKPGAAESSSRQQSHQLQRPLPACSHCGAYENEPEKPYRLVPTPDGNGLVPCPTCCAPEVRMGQTLPTQKPGQPCTADQAANTQKAINACL